MQARLTSKPEHEVITAIQALDLEPVKLRVMDPELGEGWTRDYADGIAAAYRNYLTMLVKYPDHAEDILLSEDVDEFWHTHILQTRKYMQDCQGVFGNFLHHEPHVGEVTAADLDKRHVQAEKTRQLYEREFGGTRGSEMAWSGQFGAQEAPAYSNASIHPKQAAYSNAAIRPEAAAYSNAAIRTVNAAYSNAAIDARHAAYSNASATASHAAYSNASVRASNAAYSNAAIAAKNAAYSNAAVRAERAAYSNASIRTGNAAYSNAAISARNSAYSNATICPEKAAYSNASVAPEKATGRASARPVAS